MVGGTETPNIAALPAIAWFGACESARGPDADRHVKLLIQFAGEKSLSGAHSHSRNLFEVTTLKADKTASNQVTERVQRRVYWFDLEATSPADCAVRRMGLARHE